MDHLLGPEWRCAVILFTPHSVLLVTSLLSADILITHWVPRLVEVSVKTEMNKTPPPTSLGSSSSSWGNEQINGYITIQHVYTFESYGKLAELGKSTNCDPHSKRGRNDDMDLAYRGFHSGLLQNQPTSHADWHQDQGPMRRPYNGLINSSMSPVVLDVTSKIFFYQ